jgi:hypothetical protein
MRPFMTFAATGLATLLLLKALTAFAFPVIGAVLGFALVMFKVAVVICFCFLAFWVFKRLSRPAI